MRPQSAESLRRAELAKIHVARAQLGLDEGAYRDILRRVVGVASASALDWRGRKKLLDHFKACGFRVRHAKAGKPGRALADLPQDGKIRALWLFLHEIGAVKDPSEAALGNYVKRLAQVDALQWLDDRQSFIIIETLKKWAMRVLPGKIQSLAETVSAAISSGELQLTQEEVNGLNAMVQLAAMRRTYAPARDAWEALAAYVNRLKRHGDQ